MAEIILITKKGTDDATPVAVTHQEATLQNVAETTALVSGESATNVSIRKDGSGATAKTKSYIVDFVPGETL